MFQRIREAGAWLFSSVIEPSELEQFDANQSRAVDGHGGGAYAPSSPIDIGGAGLRVLAPSAADQATPKGWVESLVSAAAAQKVTARSAWFQFTGTVADQDKFTVTKIGEIGGSFSVTSNEIVFAAAGTYAVLVKGEFTSSDSNEGVLYGFSCTPEGGATIWGGRAYGRRRSAQTGDSIALPTVAVVSIGNTSTDRLSVRATTFGTGTVQAMDATPAPCLLLLVRLDSGS